MHTDRIFRGAAALAAAAVLGTAPALRAQDTLEAGMTLEAPALSAERRAGGDRVVVGRDLVIGRDDVVEGRVVVTGGDLVVRGNVRGNVTVVRGDLRVERDAVVGGSVLVSGGDLVNAGSVGGDAHVVAGRMINNQGTVGGEMRIEGGRLAGARAVAGHEAHGGRLQMNPRGLLSRFGSGLAGILSTLALGVLLAGIGAAAVFYAHPRLDRVSDSVRADSLRAGALGVASSFLVFPLYILGIVVLALSIIGLPVLLVFIPLFPVLVMAAGALGLVAVAHALGERTAERRTLDARFRNSYAYVFTGLAVLLAPLVAANLLKMTGFLWFAGRMLEVIAKMGLLAAACVGLGALLLSRAGQEGPWRWRRPAYDPLFDGPVGGGGTGV